MVVYLYSFAQKYDMVLESANESVDVKLIKDWLRRDFDFNVLFKKNV